MSKLKHMPYGFSTIKTGTVVFGYVCRAAVWCVHACHVRVWPVQIRWPLLRSAALAARAFVAIWEQNISLAPPSLHLLTPAHPAPVWSDTE